MKRPATILEVEKFVRLFLRRESAGTVATYTAALEDYRRFADEESAVAAVWQLLRGDQPHAQKLLDRYKRSLVGVRDAKGKVVRGRGLSPASINNRVTVMRSLIKMALRERLIEWSINLQNVMDERVHDVRGPGIDVLNDMLEAAKAKPSPQGPRDYAILRLAGELGLRRGEIIRLDLEDYDPAARELRILGKGRTQKETLACSEKMAAALDGWLAVRPKPRKDAPLFTNLIEGRIERISASGVYAIIRSLGAAVAGPKGKKRISPHKIRHTAITAAVRLTGELNLAREDVKKFSRHRDYRMVARYIDAEDGAQTKLANAIGGRLH